MRDLHREGRRPSNGAAAIVDGALEPVEVPVTEQGDPPTPPAEEPSRGPEPAAATRSIDAEALSQRVAAILEPRVTSLLVARRDQWLAWMAGQFVEVSKIFEPITRVVVARVLAIGSLTAAVGVMVFIGWLIFRAVMADKSPWALVGCLAVAEACLLPIIWRGQPKAAAEPPR